MTAVRRKQIKKTFVPLTVVFVLCTVCTVEKNFHTEPERFVKIFDIFGYKLSVWKDLKWWLFLLQDYKTRTAHAEDSSALFGMLISMWKGWMDFITHLHQSLCFCSSFSDHSFLRGYHAVREAEVAKDRRIIWIQFIVATSFYFTENIFKYLLYSCYVNVWKIQVNAIDLG